MLNIDDILEELKRLLKLSNIKLDSPSVSSAVIISDGQMFGGISIKTKTKVTQLSAVQSAVNSMVQNGRTSIDSIYVYYPNKEGCHSLFDKKYLVDALVKFGADRLVYQETSDLKNFIKETIEPDYFGKEYVPPKLNFSQPKYTPKLVDDTDDMYSLLGMALDLAMVKSPKDSTYGAVIITDSGKKYLSAQYSGLDERSTIHSEIGAITRAIIDNSLDIKVLGLISSKFETESPVICGNCLQLIAELMAYYNFDITIELHSLDGKQIDSYKIQDLLTLIWDNKHNEKHQPVSDS